jgi:predicted P-loop ATPase
VKATKRTLSTASDRYRPPYGVHAQDHARTSVFAGTTNRDDWATDDTGARRFWPVECGKKIAIRQAMLDREQYFAEALVMLKQGATWWQVPDQEARDEQEKRFELDLWDEAVTSASSSLIEATTANILEKIGVRLEDQTRAHQMRVASILRHRGWKPVDARRGARVVRVWVKVSADPSPTRHLDLPAQRA